MEFEFKISLTNAGRRLDQTVVDYLQSLSRSRAANLIKDGLVLVTGKKQKPGYRTRPGDSLQIFMPEILSSEPVAENLALDVIYQDQYVIVLNKPPGLVVHPGAGNPSGTLVNALLYFNPEIRSVGDDESRPGIVHRLDKDTSGVMVVARTLSAFKFLHKEFFSRRVQKQYIALVTGNIQESSGYMDLPIGRHPKKRKMMTTGLPGSRPALTLWRVLRRYGDSTLVEVDLKTGRTHQIRVHFRALGHPLLGDTLYGFKGKKKGSRGKGKTLESQAIRQMLHARHLSFRHPFSGRRMDFEAPIYPDMETLISALNRD